MFHNLIADSGFWDSACLFLQISDKKFKRKEKNKFLTRMTIREWTLLDFFFKNILTKYTLYLGMSQLQFLICEWNISLYSIIDSSQCWILSLRTKSEGIDQCRIPKSLPTRSFWLVDAVVNSRRNQCCMILMTKNLAFYTKTTCCWIYSSTAWMNIGVPGGTQAVPGCTYGSSYA